MAEIEKLRRIVIDLDGTKDDVTIERLAEAFFLHPANIWEREDKRDFTTKTQRYRNSDNGLVVTVRDGGLVDPDPADTGTGIFFPRKLC